MPTYTSPDHSPEDPGGILKESLAMGADFPGPAEDALLAWTLRLAPEVDTQAAARTLIQRYGLMREGVDCRAPQPSPFTGEGWVGVLGCFPAAR